MKQGVSGVSLLSPVSDHLCNRIDSMKNRISKLIWAALLSLILTSGFANDSIVNQYQKLIIFGDSYSDNGNVYQLTQEAIPNSLRYYQGRFSNGPAWAEYFA